MTQATARRWEAKRTKETCGVEEVLKQAGFDRVDAYRYNAASIRVRVVDPRFEELSIKERDDLVEPVLEQLPERTQADIIDFFNFAPSELQQSTEAFTQYALNLEFEHPSPSRL